MATFLILNCLCIIKISINVCAKYISNVFYTFVFYIVSYTFFESRLKPHNTHRRFISRNVITFVDGWGLYFQNTAPPISLKRRKRRSIPREKREKRYRFMSYKVPCLYVFLINKWRLRFYGTINSYRVYPGMCSSSALFGKRRDDVPMHEHACPLICGISTRAPLRSLIYCPCSSRERDVGRRTTDDLCTRATFVRPHCTTRVE